MASLAASDADPVVVAAATDERLARPARSATTMQIAGLAGLCAIALVAPALLLVWMPIVLGVPHVASDLWYLVRPLPRRQLVVSVAACGALVALKAVALVTGIATVRGEAVVVAGWLLVMLALAQPARRSHAARRHARTSAPRSRPGTWMLASLAAFAIIALPIQFAIVAAFAHNLVAIVAWLAVARPARKDALATIAAIGAAMLVVIGVGPALAGGTGGDASPWLTIDGAARVMFAGIPQPAARALMIAFTFLQAVHYAIWLHWIPSGARTRLPTKPWLVVVAGTLAVITAALVDPVWARATYLALATFHIYLELVVLAAWAARRRA
jgi:hypothetical protein